jgi:glycosyltransferase involved in cell wall biosynthesis
MNIWYFHPYAGGPGIGRYYRPYRLAKAWNDMGHRTEVFVASYHHLLEGQKPLAEKIPVDGVLYNALPARTYEGNGAARLLNMFDYCRSMLRLSRQQTLGLEKPDVVIISSPHPFAFYPAWWLARRHGAKLVFEVRDLWPLSMVEITGMSRWHPLVLFLALTERLAYRTSDLVASLLAGVEDYMIERHMAYKAFVCIPNGLEPEAEIHPTVVHPLVDTIKAWRADGKKVIIHPGAMGPPNGLDLLIEAMAYLSAGGHGERFVAILLGDGVDRQKLQELAERKGCHNVIFAPSVSKAVARQITAACDFGYLGGKPHPTLYKYGISFNKLLDFVALGKPCILPMTARLPDALARHADVMVCEPDAESVAHVMLKMEEMTSLSRAPQPKLIEALSYPALAREYEKAIVGCVVR